MWDWLRKLLQKTPILGQRQPQWSEWSKVAYKEASDESATSVIICKDQQITAGISAELYAFDRWTLYLWSDGINWITIQLSPGSDYWCEIDESPVEMASDSCRVIEMGYDGYFISLTASEAANVTGIIRGVY